jgi:hypothetical protein
VQEGWDEPQESRAETSARSARSEASEAELLGIVESIAGGGDAVDVAVDRLANLMAPPAEWERQARHEERRRSVKKLLRQRGGRLDSSGGAVAAGGEEAPPLGESRRGGRRATRDVRPRDGERRAAPSERVAS